jgi:hypothetical protein
MPELRKARPGGIFEKHKTKWSGKLIFLVKYPPGCAQKRIKGYQKSNFKLFLYKKHTENLEEEFL